MAVRFKRTGTTDIKDHKDLLNKGTRTHAEIDTYLSEIDVARGTFTDLDGRLDSIDTKNNAQDNRLTAIETKNTAQDNRLTAIETKNTEQDTKISDLSDSQVKQDERLDELEEIVNDLADVDISEVIDARTDKNGITYSSLKERLDAQQGVGGGSGPGNGNLVSASGYLFQVLINELPNRRTVIVDSPYAVGKNEIEVFRGGIRQIRDIHYTEVNMSTISIMEPLRVDEVVIIRRRDRLGAIQPLHLTDEVLMATNSNRVFSVATPFNSPYKSLEVYYNGVLLIPEDEYVTDLSNKVTFLFDPMPGSLILFQVVDKNKKPDQYQLEEHQDIVNGQDTYTISTFTFTENELEVYVQGVRWYEGIDYTEVDNKTVRFISPLPPNGKISFLKETNFNPGDIEERLTELENSIPDASVTVNQLELKNVVAAASNPLVKVIDIKANTSFTNIPVNVLLFKEGQQDVVQEISSFDNSINFTTGDGIEINGKMYLKNNLETNMILENSLGDGSKIFSLSIDLAIYKKINSIKTIN